MLNRLAIVDVSLKALPSKYKTPSVELKVVASPAPVNESANLVAIAPEVGI